MSFEDAPETESMPRPHEMFERISEIDQVKEAAISAARRLAGFETVEYADEISELAELPEKEAGDLRSTLYELLHLMPQIRQIETFETVMHVQSEQVIEPHTGPVESFLGAVLIAAQVNNRTYKTQFNGVDITVTPDATVQDLYQLYRA